MKKQLSRFVPASAFVALLLAPLPGCHDENSGNNSTLADSAPASSFDADLARAWMDELYQLVKAGGTAPPPASRIYAYAGVALYESCVHGMADHQTLAGQLNGLAALPQPVDAEHHWPSVANRAMAVIASNFFAASQVEIDGIEAGFDTTFDASISSDVRARSIQYGEDIAGAIIAWSISDGFVDGNNNWCGYTAPAPAGAWAPVPPASGIGLLPCWGTLQTFAVADGTECAPVPAPPFSASSASEWYAEALQVYNVTGVAGASLSTEQKLIAKFWADGPTATGTPPGHWFAVVGIITSLAAYDSLDVAAEAYARVGIAVADAFITCWNTKYLTYLQRPITYIQANIDVTWTPYIGTPNFPTYTSGHSTQSGAAAVVLTDMFGPLGYDDDYHLTYNPNLSDPVQNPAESSFYVSRHFDNFLEAANEAAVSRLYGGIHYAFDDFEGFNSGQCVGAIISANVQFLK